PPGGWSGGPAHGIASIPAADAEAAAPRFSVIIPTYNRGHVIEEAIDSVMVQRAGDFELIVVDDGSTDDTRQRLERIHDRRVRRPSLPHRRGAAARKTGSSATPG